jgi:methylmalonyl-CoA/ethylmalonyl-CoA epimerase
MGFFDCNGIRLMLSASETGETYSSVVYFKVPDIDTAYETLREREVAFEGEPHIIARMPDHELWMAFFRDPDRNLLALMSEVPLEAA